MLGVDVSKAELHGTWRDPETQRIGWQGVVPNTEAGIRQLLRRVPAGASLVVEPTGRYGEPLVRPAVAAGRAVLLATPRRARAFPSTRCTRDRTFADRYARERAKGLATTAALNAVARKLAKVAWSLVAHGSAYDPTRVDTQPPPPAADADSPAPDEAAADG